MTITDLPHLNAALNTVAAGLLLVGFGLIRRGRVRGHAVTMILAILVSAAFLTSYLVYHFHVPARRVGEMHWVPQWLRVVYLAILFPHLILAIVMLPMIAWTLWRAGRRQWAAHRRIARPTLFVWLYVSVTGVIIYAMLYHLFVGMARQG